jgi:hypothetical protein
MPPLAIVERGKVRLGDLPEGTIVGGVSFYGSRRGTAWCEFKKVADALAKKCGGLEGTIQTRKDLWKVTYYFTAGALDEGYLTFKEGATKLQALNPIPEGIDVYAYDRDLDEEPGEDEDSDDEENE